MIKLNLISPEQKDYLRYEFIYLSIRAVVWMVVIFSVTISAIFLSARLLLEENYNTLVTETILVNQRNLIIDKEIDNLNSRLREVAALQKDFVKWSNFLADLTANIPPGISISLMTIEKSSSTLTLLGQATTREDFLTLKNNLERLPYLSQVQSPITNLLLRQNIDFQFTSQVNFIQLR